MSELGPPLYTPPRSETAGGLYRDVVDVAFDVMLGDVAGERKRLERRRKKRKVSRLEQPEIAVNGLAELEKVLDSRLARVKGLVFGLDALKAAYRARFGVGVGRRCVPAQRRMWTPADRQEVLYHLANVIYDDDLAEAVYQDAHLLRELWEDGRFRVVERLCDEADETPVASHSEEVERLLASRIPRRASGAAHLLTSRRVPARRRSVSADPPEHNGSRLRSTTRRTPNVRPGG
jgi:hypothetical protein